MLFFQKKYRLFLLFVLCFFFPKINAQETNAHKLQRNADRNYWEGVFDKAAEDYKKAEELSPEKLAPSYNRGNSEFKQEQYAEAEKSYQKALAKAKTPDQKAAALHNLGNAYYQQQKLEKAKEAYKESLKLNPGDAATAKNLALTRKRQEQQKQQQEQQQKQDEQQKENKQQQPQPQKNEENKDKPEKEKDENQAKPKPQDGEHQEQHQPQPAQGEDDLLLRIAEQEEQRVEKKLQEQNAGQRAKNGKDW